LTLVMASVVVLWVGYLVVGPNGYLALREREREAQILRQDVQRLTLENMRLSGRVEALQNDPREVERVARQEMKLARPGEVIFVLPPPQPKK
jgi:cell division protein FtsB